MTHDDIVRAARVIHTFGSPGKYYSMTKIYLVSPDGRYRWWTEDRHFTDATLVNRGNNRAALRNPERAIDRQRQRDAVRRGRDHLGCRAPDRATARPTTSSSCSRGHAGTYPPHVLDLGCGTGRVLDLGLVTPDRYAAVDSSQAMLNVLVRKHPKVAAVYPTDVRDAARVGTFTPGQFDWVFLDAAVDLDAAQRSQVEQIARLAVITVTADDWTVENVTEASLTDTLALADRCGRHHE